MQNDVVTLVGVEVHDFRMKDAPPNLIGLIVIGGERKIILARATEQRYVGNVLVPREGIDLENVMITAALQNDVTPARDQEILAVAGIDR